MERKLPYLDVLNHETNLSHVYSFTIDYLYYVKLYRYCMTLNFRGALFLCFCVVVFTIILSFTLHTCQHIGNRK